MLHILVRISMQFPLSMFGFCDVSSRLKLHKRLRLPLETFFNTIFVSSHMYPENPEGTRAIVGSMNTGYISDTARNRAHNLFRPKREPIPLCYSDGHHCEYRFPIFHFDEDIKIKFLINFVRTLLSLEYPIPNSISTFIIISSSFSNSQPQ